MEDLIAKLENEHGTLLKKVERLDEFLEGENLAERVGAAQTYLLKTQLSAMVLYLHTLEARIDDLKNRKEFENANEGECRQRQTKEKRENTKKEETPKEKERTDKELKEAIVDELEKFFHDFWNVSTKICRAETER